MKRLSVILVAITALCFCSCKKIDIDLSSWPIAYPPPGYIELPPTSYFIDIRDTAFIPSMDTASLFTSVVWTNQDTVIHTVSCEDTTIFNSGDILKGDSFVFTPDSLGTFPYHCKYHGERGTLVIAY